MSQPRAAIGLDVGGTATKAVVCDDDGQILARAEVPTPPQAVGLMDSLAAVVVTLEAAVPAGTVLEPAVALCVPGIVDDTRGVAVHSTNLGWRDAPLAAQLAERLGRPALLGHDVRAGGLAELRWGAAAGSASMMFVAVGTGIATALVLDGRPVVAGGYAGESGHVLVPDPDSGQPVLLEQVASASAIARRWSERSGRTAAGSLEVFQAAEQEDPVAAEVIADAVEVLADVLACQLALVGPVPVVVGGGLSKAGDAVLRPLRSEIDRRLVLFDAPPVTAARLGSWAGAMGSAALALGAGRAEGAA
ncbi:ROK family protein [Auraticoccus monumenti]|uniref:Glucokinase n=1 Tax=Auraticoccus monumenti TaxID=675864 RepID=A0A1G6ZFA2_9ACTN|nr:ROK family protein [Auraticoccus monumenti]SDE01131.1 glucokinase [Auraticoccus monumenti]